MTVEVQESPAAAAMAKHDDTRLTDADFSSLLASLQPHEELATLSHIENLISETSTRRAGMASEMSHKISTLQASLDELRKNSTRAATDWRSLHSHREVMAKLDNQKFDLAKSINEQEARLSALQSELLEVKRLHDEVQDEDVETEGELDRDALCLKIFRGLGFLPAKDEMDADAGFTSILVRSDKRNAALPIEVSEPKLKQSGISPFVLANQLWKAAD
ncbi:uncharacterized protein PFL1_00466 [Pseudozyma flocculosa PF-1]|uniref:Kinetochore protein Spc24 n=1 Tax=Pseudozyma flocculosa TaxID=84751 RepID=A0A5C3ERD5_9BASI|nr:uncharacterized protein PFL1_00466 [Pseudozyma flocculosa PF-1]EPQ32269.1 hypothetical protein PFL1_00466 [Pseudozyma flocculosa PF-1]SPO34778.1 uncharacterized protein PSFLO_00249 [Pseudozyma flocculosa]